jgi:hypothetical protein
MPTSTLGHGGTYKPVLAIIYGEGILTWTYNALESYILAQY